MDISSGRQVVVFGVISRRIDFAGLLAGSTSTYTLKFDVCAQVLAGSSLRIDAIASIDGGGAWKGNIGELETVGIHATSNKVVKLINVDDDHATFVYKVPVKATVRRKNELIYSPYYYYYFFVICV